MKDNVTQCKRRTKMNRAIVLAAVTCLAWAMAACSGAEQGRFCERGSCKLVALSAGSAHNCALTEDGRVFCWGSDTCGVCGDGPGHSDVPVEVDFSEFGVKLVRISTQISTQYVHSCALSEDGRAFCWGADGSGELGDGPGSLLPKTTDCPPSADRPVEVRQEGLVFKEISAGGEHTCGLTIDGRIYCWGYNDDGQLGNGALNNSDTPVPVDARSIGSPVFSQVSAGKYHTCAITADGQAYCWGSNGDGKLGFGGDLSDNISALPVPVETSGMELEKTFKWISAGSSFTCGVTTAGRIYCWGDNIAHQLGSDSASESEQCPNDPWLKVLPTPVREDFSGPVSYKMVTAGFEHTCGVAEDGRVFCWGRNSDGKLGIGSVNPSGCSTDWPYSPSPIQVYSVGYKYPEYTTVSAGVFHTCAINTNKDAYCWGSDFSGQIGNGPESLLCDGKPCDTKKPTGVNMSLIE